MARTKKLETVEEVKVENVKKEKTILDKKKAYIDLNDVIIKMVVSEKSGKLAGVQNENGKIAKNVSGRTLTFIVDKRANKIQIKKAVEKIFGMEVEKVNTANYDGKLRTQGRSQGYTASYKKAYVTFVEGSNLSDYVGG